MRFVIVNTVDWEACRSLAAGQVPEDEVARRLTGCVWLFRARGDVDDPEEALREAIRSFFASEEGRRVLRAEEAEAMGWESAIPWIPDEVWSRYGLEAVRHPDVERLVVDGNEDLLSGPSAGPR